MALEAAGRGILDSFGSCAAASLIPAQTTQPDVAEQIRNLADLHAAGVVTDEEFAAKRPTSSTACEVSDSCGWDGDRRRRWRHAPQSEPLVRTLTQAWPRTSASRRVPRLQH
jgi:hypothetical protein